MKLYCLPRISLTRLKKIVCHLCQLDPTYYRLQSLNGDMLEEDTQLSNVSASMDNQQMLLISSADIKCAVEYQGQTVTIAAVKETLVSSIFEEALKKLGISNEDSAQWKVNLLDDPESPTEIDLDLSVSILLDALPENTTLVPLQLIRS